MKKVKNILAVVASAILTIASLATSAFADSFETAIVSGINSFASSIDVTEYANENNWTARQVVSETRKVFNQHPELCWIESVIELQVIPGELSATGVTQLNIAPSYVATGSAAAEMQAKTESEALAIISKIDANASAAQKAKEIHDSLVNRVEYDLSNPKRDMYSALVTGKAVCMGYAFAYKYLLSFVGIDSIVVVSDDRTHAWNLIDIDGNWYHVDVTWDDTTSSDDFFLKSDKEFVKDHPSWSGVPAATNNYFVEATVALSTVEAKTVSNGNVTEAVAEAAEPVVAKVLKHWNKTFINREWLPLV